MKIDKSILDTFSSIGVKNIQQQGAESAVKSDGTAGGEAVSEKAGTGDALMVVAPAASAESEAAVKLSGAEELEAKSFIKSVNGTPEEKMAVIRMAKSKGIAITKGNLTALHRVLTDKNPAAALEKGLSSVDASLESNEMNKVVNQLQSLLQKINGQGGTTMGVERIQGGFTLIEVTMTTSENEGTQSFLLDRFTAKELVQILAAVIKGALPAATAQKLLSGNLTESTSETEITLTAEQVTLIGENLMDALTTLKLPKWSAGEGKSLADLWTETEQSAPSVDSGKPLKVVELTKTVEQVLDVVAESTDVNQEIQDLTDSDQETDALIQDMLLGLEQSISAMVENLQTGQGGLDQASSSNIRQVLRVEVTARMVEAKGAFATMKKDLAGLVQKAETPLPVEEKARILKSVVEKLDNFIMKSDAMMYTSMKNERDLLKTSSTLQDALKLLAKGKSDEAFAVTKKAMAELDKMIFKPSARRVEAHLASKLSAWQSGGSESDLEEQLKSRLQKALGNTSKHIQQPAESSGRLLMEMMRKLGLNNEFEKSEHILKAAAKKDFDGDERLDDNVKAVLLKMADDHKNSAAVEPVQKALETLRGTQLMNRHEVGRDEQTMMFVVPWGQQMDQSVKVMVNGRKNGGVMSWENCSLYFSFDTKRLGQTGIRVTIQDKTINMSVFNDSDNSKQILAGYLDKLYQGFVEVGFQKGTVGYSKLGLSENQNLGKSQNNPVESRTVTVQSAAVQQTTGSSSTTTTEVSTSRGFELKI